MKTRAIVLMSLGLYFLSTVLVSAQSFKFNTDKTITFSVRAPKAISVELSAQFLPKNQPMLKSENGLWTVTIGPVSPNIYPYNFVIDGLSVADPSNMDLFPNENFKSSIIDVPDDQPSLTSALNVPHGQVRYCLYESSTLKRQRPLLVYTPPGYDANSNKYPVFYLVSGTTDTEETWYKVGKVHLIMDNLIAQKKAVPMIVVMPYGNMMNGTPQPNTPQAAEMYKVFSDELIKNIMPFIDANFRVQSNRLSRAIAGFSRGGGQSLYAGLANLDKFAWIGSYSAYLTPNVFDAHFPQLASNPQQLNSKLKLFWFGVGKSDFLYNDAVQFTEYLKTKGVVYRSIETEGGHTWMNARHYLGETLQLYFKNN
jgi:enterochelin esterase-like enzyme